MATKPKQKKVVESAAQPAFTAKAFLDRLKAHQSDEELQKFTRYFKFEVGKQSKDDYFIGVRMGQVFELAKEFIEMPPVEIEKLLDSPIHEARVGACSIMDKQGRSKKTTETRMKELYDLYMRRHDRVMSWDLVDLAGPYVVGRYLFDKPRDILYKLARSKSMVERRTAIVATGFFIRKRDISDTFAIAEILVKDKEDLIHKATGWMLRAAGDHDRAKLTGFLDKHAATMPRVLLRYAIEHLDEKLRAHYLGMKSSR
jgi:3-methyladenine DNA glycosylase AlkD